MSCTSSSPGTQLQTLQKQWGIGLTGGIATGKSLVATMLKSLGVPVIDADTLSRQVASPGSQGLESIVLRFGQTVLLDDGSLNRRALRQLIFADPGAKQQLESILHPLIQTALWEHLVQLGLDQAPKIWCFEASLLVETGNHERYREVWVTHCRRDTQIQRLMNRDGVTRQQALAALSSQADPATKLPVATLVLDTDQAPAALEKAVANHLKKLR